MATVAILFFDWTQDADRRLDKIFEGRGRKVANQVRKAAEKIAHARGAGHVLEDDVFAAMKECGLT